MEIKSVIIFICFNYSYAWFQIYLNNKAQIDPVLDQVKAKLDEVSGKVFAMIPQGKGAAEKKEE